MNIEIDSGSGFVAQPDQMGGYVRENSTEELSSSTTGVGLFFFSANDKIRITVYDTVTNEPDEATTAYSQRLILEYIDRTGRAAETVDNLKDIGDVNANAPQEGQVLTFNGATSTWQSCAVPQTDLTEIAAASGGWNSTYTTVNANSAIQWNYQGTDLKALSANWESTYTTVSANSATWEAAGPPSSNVASSTTATAYANGVVIGLTITPGAGTYLVMAKSNIAGPGGNSLVSMTIRQNGANITYSDAEYITKDAADYTTICSQAIATVADGQAIDVINTSGATRTFENRSLILVEVSP